MNIDEIINFVEEEDFELKDSWYFHATKNDIEVIKKIFNEGIKSSYLMGDKPNHFNGKYYISLYKYNNLKDGLNLWLDKYPRFVIDDITPFYAFRKHYKINHIFINTRLPFRTSEWDGEYQQYLMIDKSKFVAFGYDLFYILNDIFCSDKSIEIKLKKEKLELLKNVILYMERANINLPIYDFSTMKKINKEKVLSFSKKYG